MISILIPLFNEQQNIAPLLDELTEEVEKLDDDFEFVFVNDGSRDGSLAVLLAAAQADSRVKVIDLARNFGKEAAISCGLDHVSSDAVIIMDADLQHPPDVIGKMLSLWRDGHDMVVPVNQKRTDQPLMNRSAARLFYRIMRMMSRVEIVPDGSDFRLMDRKIVDVIRQLREVRRFMKAIYAWPGYSVCTFPYDVRPRRGGRSTWKIWGLWNFALEGIFNFSSLPLRIWTYLGFVIALVAGIWGLSIGIRALIYGPNVVQGITTVAIFVFFTLALVMIQGGIQGEYLARIFDEVKRRPLYVVRKVYRYEYSANEKETALDEASDQRG